MMHMCPLHQLKSDLNTKPKLYIPSTLNIDLILWHTQLIVCAENVKSWGFPFTFQAYTLLHTLNCICVSLFKFEFQSSFITGQKGPLYLLHIKE